METVLLLHCYLLSECIILIIEWKSLKSSHRHAPKLDFPISFVPSASICVIVDWVWQEFFFFKWKRWPKRFLPFILILWNHGGYNNVRYIIAILQSTIFLYSQVASIYIRIMERLSYGEKYHTNLLQRKSQKNDPHLQYFVYYRPVSVPFAYPSLSANNRFVAYSLYAQNSSTASLNPPTR